MATKPKVQLLLKENYLAMIENSVGTKMFRDVYAIVDGKRRNITKEGQLSCAYLVSPILLTFRLIDSPHVTVEGLLKDMERNGWEKIQKPKKGCVLLWERKALNGGEHEHVGFYIGGEKAVHNSFQKKIPLSEHWTFCGKRNVESIYWHKKLE